MARAACNVMLMAYAEARQSSRALALLIAMMKCAAPLALLALPRCHKRCVARLARGVA